MKDLEKNKKNLQKTLDRAKKLINRIKNENSKWFNLGINNKDIRHAMQLLKEIEMNLALLSDTVGEIPSEIADDEQKKALLQDGINLTFSDLSAIYSSIKQIRKSIKLVREQRSNVKYLDANFSQFENHYMKLDRRLDTLLSARTNEHNMGYNDYSQ